MFSIKHKTQANRKTFFLPHFNLAKLICNALVAKDLYIRNSKTKNFPTAATFGGPSTCLSADRRTGGAASVARTALSSAGTSGGGSRRTNQVARKRSWWRACSSARSRAERGSASSVIGRAGRLVQWRAGGGAGTKRGESLWAICEVKIESNGFLFLFSKFFGWLPITHISNSFEK